MREVLPAVTCTAQATLLTGQPVSKHGIVANGWLFRDTQEVRFWQQSNRLIQAEPFYATAHRRATERGRNFRSAKLFWWFNQGADVSVSITPKPHYGISGKKVFGISGTPPGYAERLEKELGKFPFFTFWGPGAGLPCTQWIGRCAATLVQQEPLDLTLVYLPHLDYDPQRFGVSGSDMPKLVRELDDACAPILDAAQKIGANVWVVSEYGHCDVSKPIYPNRALMQAKLIASRMGPFGEQLDLFNCRAFAVCDHQLAHVYVPNANDIPQVAELLGALPGVAKVLVGEQRAEIDIDHERAGEIVLLSALDAWFAYPYWLDDRRAPDYARAVAIHHKPGYDPCELFIDPKFRLPKFHMARRLVQKLMGFRMVMDVVPLDASLVKGSHGLHAIDVQDGPLWIGSGRKPENRRPEMTAFAPRVLEELGLAE